MPSRWIDLRRFQREESGQDLIEYALVAAMIAFAAIAGMNFVGFNDQQCV